MITMGVVVGVALYVLVVLARCSFKVEEGHLALLTTFGRAETTDGKRKLQTYGPGMHAKKPWQRVVTVSMKEQTLDLNREEGGGTAMSPLPARPDRLVKR